MYKFKPKKRKIFKPKIYLNNIVSLIVFAVDNFGENQYFDLFVDSIFVLFNFSNVTIFYLEVRYKTMLLLESKTPKLKQVKF
jgi:hypothetical protein